MIDPTSAAEARPDPDTPPPSHEPTAPRLRQDPGRRDAARKNLLADSVARSLQAVGGLDRGALVEELTRALLP